MTRHPPSEPAADADSANPAARDALYVAPAVALLFHLGTAGLGGFFRDELYYLANADHLGFGYVEHPPLIGWLTFVFRAVLGDSLVAIRVMPALAGAATVAFAVLLATELGGRRRAQWLSATLVFLLPHFVATFGFLSMNATDNLVWAAGSWLFVRILRTGNGRLWPMLGLIAGLGLLNKVSVLFFGFGLVAGLVVARRWEPFRDRRLWLGGAIAAVIALPYGLWLAFEGWPLLEFMANARERKNVLYTPVEYLGSQVVQVLGPALPLAVLAGLVYLLWANDAKPFRAVGWSFVAVLALMLAMTGAKPYYLAPAYTPIVAAGAVAIDRWCASLPRLGRTAFAMVSLLLVAGTAPLLPFTKPLLPVESFLRYQAALGFTPPSSERNAQAALPQHLADRFGWPELARDVAGVFGQLSEDERIGACVFAQNYGQAGAIDRFGPELGLPPAISGHNSYFLWGPRDCGRSGVLVVVGDDREGLERWFEDVELGAVHRCEWCMPYERDLPIWIARNPKQDLREAWELVKNYI